jgi:hypothetical protein
MFMAAIVVATAANAPSRSCRRKHGGPMAIDEVGEQYLAEVVMPIPGMIE